MIYVNAVNSNITTTDNSNDGIPAYEAALKASNIKYELFVYDNVNHAFHNDTAPARYNEEAAKLSWERTLGFFAKFLKA